MAKKTFVCTGGYLRGENGKMVAVAAGTEVEIEEETGNSSRLLKPKVEAKKLVVNDDKKPAKEPAKAAAK